jgi:AhpD family alkylhydroperoxidase
MSKKIIDDFTSRRDKGNELVMQQDFLPYKRFYNLDTNAYSEGAIPSKYKELMGLSSSMVLRCNDCIVYHLKKSVEAGCSRDEINEAMNIALVIGGSIVIPHLRHALAALEEIMTGEQ